MARDFVFMQNASTGRNSSGHGREGAVRLSGAQMAMLIEGLDWRHAIVHEEVATPTLA